jgi:hypothetical protein
MTYMKMNGKLGSLLLAIDEFSLLIEFYKLGILHMSFIWTQLSRLSSKLAYHYILMVLKIGSQRFEISQV